MMVGTHDSGATSALNSCGSSSRLVLRRRAPNFDMRVAVGHLRLSLELGDRFSRPIAMKASSAVLNSRSGWSVLQSCCGNFDDADLPAGVPDPLLGVVDWRAGLPHLLQDRDGDQQRRQATIRGSSRRSPGSLADAPQPSSDVSRTPSPAAVERRHLRSGRVHVVFVRDER